MCRRAREAGGEGECRVDGGSGVVGCEVACESEGKTAPHPGTGQGAGDVAGGGVSVEGCDRVRGAGGGAGGGWSGGGVGVRVASRAVGRLGSGGVGGGGEGGCGGVGACRGVVRGGAGEQPREGAARSGEADGDVAVHGVERCGNLTLRTEG